MLFWDEIEYFLYDASMERRSLMSSLLHILVLFVIAYVAYVLLLVFFQEQLIFFPQRITSERWQEVAKEVQGELVTLEAHDGVKLRGWFLPGIGNAPRPTVLFFGGNAMQLHRFARAVSIVRRAGVHVLLVDYRGYGLSEGKPSTDAMRRDSEVIYDATVGRADVDAARIAAWGVSIGTGIAMHLASVRPISRVILIAPFTSMVDVAREHYPYLPVGTFLRHKLDNLVLAPTLFVPALIIAGGADEIQSPSHAEKLAAAWGGERTVRVFANRGHNDLFVEEEVWERIISFLQS